MSTERDIWNAIQEIQGVLEPLRKVDAGGVVTTYTPTYDGAVSGSTTYTTQAGFYMRDGNRITAWGTLVWTAASGTGNAQISLPIAASSTTNSNLSGSVRVTTVTFAAGTPQVLITASSTFFLLQSPATNAASTTVQVEAAGNIVFTVVYTVD
jgi:hypothetical protein